MSLLSFRQEKNTFNIFLAAGESDVDVDADLDADVDTDVVFKDPAQIFE